MPVSGLAGAAMGAASRKSRWSQRAGASVRKPGRDEGSPPKSCSSHPCVPLLGPLQRGGYTALSGGGYRRGQVWQRDGTLWGLFGISSFNLNLKGSLHTSSQVQRRSERK